MRPARPVKDACSDSSDDLHGFDCVRKVDTRKFQENKFKSAVNQKDEKVKSQQQNELKIETEEQKEVLC